MSFLSKRCLGRRRVCLVSWLCPSAVFLLLVFALLVFSTQLTEGFPFARSSGVTELTPTTLPAFVQSHKPVVILFYAPWCGHCKQFHPEYERFAQSSKGAIRVGAINADQYSEIGQQFDVRGFPTIKTWGMGKKSLNSPTEYQGPRTVNGLQSHMMGSVSSSRVSTTVASADALKAAVQAAPKQKAAVLFSSRKNVPAIFSILAHSPKLADLPFIFIDDTTVAAGAAFGIEKLPTMAVVQTKKDEPDAYETVPFTGQSIAYEPLAKFFLAAVEGEAPRGAATAEARSVQLDDVVEGAADGSTRRPRRALPVGPTPFNKDVTIPDFCASPTAAQMKLNDRVVTCVITLSDAVDLKAVHAQYQNERFLFFDASQTPVAELEAALGEHLNGLTLAAFDLDAATEKSGSMLLIRKTKARQVRLRGFSDITSTEKLTDVMEQLASGNVHTKRWKL